jgi:AICAR transformylase/IMP cyclohydrolase PurH
MTATQRLRLARKTISDAYNVALACDPTSAFGGVLIANTKLMLQQQLK